MPIHKPTRFPAPTKTPFEITKTQQTFVNEVRQILQLPTQANIPKFREEFRNKHIGRVIWSRAGDLIGVIMDVVRTPATDSFREVNQLVVCWQIKATSGEDRVSVILPAEKSSVFVSSCSFDEITGEWRIKPQDTRQTQDAD
jgi:hypothetical protein